MPKLYYIVYIYYIYASQDGLKGPELDDIYRHYNIFEIKSIIIGFLLQVFGVGVVKIRDE